MTLADNVDRWLRAWRTGDAATLSELVTSYADPDTDDPVWGSGLRDHLDAVFARFPTWDLTVDHLADAGPTAVITWSARLPHRASYLGIPATAGTASVRGCDVLTLDEDGTGVRARRHFDRLELARSLDHRARFLPPESDGMEYGTSFRSAGRSGRAEVLALTWLDVRDDAEGSDVTLLSTEVVKSLRASRGFLGASIVEVGDRRYTLSAFDSEAALRAVHARPHQRALRRFFRGGLCSGVYTSVWRLDRDSLYLRCPECESTLDASDGAPCDCGWTPPDPPLF